MANITELLPEIAAAALVIEPELVGVPVVGRLLTFLAKGHGGDTQAIEDLQKKAEAKKTERKTRKERNNRYVLKASDAMDCVEKHLMDGGILLAFGKGIVNAILGKSDFAPDILLDQIWTCIEEKTLRQDTPRVISSKRIYHRPAKGHGIGRGKF